MVLFHSQVCLVGAEPPLGLFVGGAEPPLGGSLCFVFYCPDWKMKKTKHYLRNFIGPNLKL